MCLFDTVQNWSRCIILILSHAYNFPILVLHMEFVDCISVQWRSWTSRTQLETRFSSTLPGLTDPNVVCFVIRLKLLHRELFFILHHVRHKLQFKIQSIVTLIVRDRLQFSLPIIADKNSTQSAKNSYHRQFVTYKCHLYFII